MTSFPRFVVLAAASMLAVLVAPPGARALPGQPTSSAVAALPASTRVAALDVAVRRQSGWDFVGPYQSLRPRSGSIPAVAICFDPGRTGHEPPSADYLRALHDGHDLGRNVATWYWENSAGQFGFANPTYVGCTDGGWLRPPAGRDGDWYWKTGNFELMWRDALTAADPYFDFGSYDRDGDGHLTGEELVVEIIRPQNEAYGTTRTARADLDGISEMAVDVLDLYLSPFTDITNRLSNVGLIAHESAHDILGAVDLYSDFDTRPGWYSIMDRHWRANHLDPFHKLKSGFVNPHEVNLDQWTTGTVTLAAVETRWEITIVHDPARGRQEYFILENRWGGAGNYDETLDVQGVAVWHIVEDIATQDQFPPPGSTADSGDWGRKGIRLLTVLSDPGQSVTLAYADGTDAGVRITAQAGPQEFLDTEIAKI